MNYWTLIRVFDIEENIVYLIFPSYNPNVIIGFDKSIFPDYLINNFEKDFRFFAKCKIINNNYLDLLIEFYEFKQ